MSHDSRLDLCGVCRNRSFSTKLGVVCILTNDRPDFEDDCEDFIEDPVALVSSVREKDQQKVKEYQPSERFAKSMHGVGKDQRIVLGVFNMLVALIWFGIAFFYFGKMTYMPMLVFAFGLFKLIDGIIKRRKESKIQELLDEELNSEN